MENQNNIKNTVQKMYREEIAHTEDIVQEGCACGGTCGGSASSELSEDYTSLEGYHPYADLGLGCGLPTEYIPLKEGNLVVDLGCGAGNDSFVARELVGMTGKVIGIDITPEMVDRARRNAEMAGYNNVEFRQGDIETVPVSDEVANAVISNCVLTQVPDRAKVLSEAYRIVKHHGHISFADIMTTGNVPQEFRQDAEFYLGALTGAPSREGYIKLFEDAGFENVQIVDMKHIQLPDAMVRYHLDEEQLRAYRNQDFGIYTATITAEKPCCKSEHGGEHDHHHEHAGACGCGGQH
jgi:SAM-dependent methyltransferase